MRGRDLLLAHLAGLGLGAALILSMAGLFAGVLRLFE